MTSAFWTDERIELLKTLWGDGVSASQVARRIGDGVTRSAIIGKVHRLKLASRVTEGPRRYPVPSKRVRTFRPPRAKPVPFKPMADDTAADPPAGELLTLEQINESNCKWICQDGTWEQPRYCGRQVVSGHPYCAAHCKRAFNGCPPIRKVRHDYGPSH